MSRNDELLPRFGVIVVEYPDEGTMGPYDTREEAEEAARTQLGDDETEVVELTAEEATALEADDAPQRPWPACDTMYAYRNPAGGPLRNIYCAPMLVRMHEHPPEDIVKVRIVPDPEGEYYAWHDYEKNTWEFVFEAEVLLAICFPYGPECSEQRGEGSRQRVRVEIV